MTWNSLPLNAFVLNQGLLSPGKFPLFPINYVLGVDLGILLCLRDNLLVKSWSLPFLSEEAFYNQVNSNNQVPHRC